MERPIFPACYLPPVSYFQVLLKWKEQGVWLEQHEHFPKQTYRNRASIYGANGKLDLIIPVKHAHAGRNHQGQSSHTKMSEVPISYEADWQRLHWMSIQTAYRSSAYFEYYEDAFEPFYKQRFEGLLDYNIQLTRLILKLLKINVALDLTEHYNKDVPAHLDYRQSIHPKLRLAQASPTPTYHQVFADRHGFLPDLSIVDLLFNYGPQSLNILL